MIKKYIIPILILTAAIFIVKGLVSSKEKKPAIQLNERIWRVETENIATASLSPVITLYGKVETAELLNAAAPASSRVAAVLVKEGQQVEKGDLILSLDKQDFEPLLKQAEARVKELQAQIVSENLKHQINLQSLKHEEKLLLLNEKALNRAEKVKRQKLGSISETELALQLVEKQRLSLNAIRFAVNEHDSRLLQLEAKLSQAEADYEKSKLAMERSQIIAPFSGVVAKVNVSAGDMVSINEKLLSLYSLEKLDVRTKIPVTILPEIKRDLRAGKKLRGLISAGYQPATVTLERISGEATASGADAIFSFDEASTDFRIGAIVVVRLQRAHQENLIKVPYQAMYGQNRLYKVVEHRLQAVAVETVGEYQLESTAEQLLLIRSNELKPGDQIMVTHLPNAYSGLKVEVITQN